MGRARRTVRELSERYRFDVDPDALVEDLPVGVQQRVEILKALANDARFLIFDEPTAVLTPQEIDELMDVMRSLRDEGKAIVFITHKLREVRAIADTITVIRRGKVVGTAEPTDSEARLAELMVGRAVNLVVDKEPAQPQRASRGCGCSGVSVANAAGAVVVDGPRPRRARRRDRLRRRRPGQRPDRARRGPAGHAAGDRRARSPSTARPISGRTPKEIIDAGLGFVPEDRQHDGFVGSFTVAENLVLNHFDEAPFATGIRARPGARSGTTPTSGWASSTSAPSRSRPRSRSLSGGNQQKVVLARELSRPLAALVASQPTRGVDVGAIEFLHTRLVAERDRGTAVLIVSTELDEVAALADRVAVMYRGRIVGVVPPGHLARGARPDDGRRARRRGARQRLGHHPGRGGRGARRGRRRRPVDAPDRRPAPRAAPARARRRLSASRGSRASAASPGPTSSPRWRRSCWRSWSARC